MFKEKAHDITSKIRTEDVIISGDIRFKDLLLSPDTLKGLEMSGFKKPSPIQKKAIPLGRCGFDLIVQAKSGTGKTCVFAVIALEMLQCQNDKLQVLILSPTREISYQIKGVISSIGQGFKKLKISEFIGGTPLNDDKVNLQKCQIAVGTPGRVKHLISQNIMKLDSVKLFVLDEADRLMEDNFRKDVSFIYLKLPEVKQMIAASATFPPSLENFVTQYMTNPVRIKAGTEVFLLGIRQFVTIVPSHMSAIVQFNNKVQELARILSFVPFNQCLVFSNYQSRGESICSVLNKLDWPAVCINGSQQQKTRLKTIASLKNFKIRVLVTTDLTSRGIDAENVNLVVNLDLPYDSVTYMHRIGRAGRYGTPGLALTIVEEGAELIQFQKMLNEVGGKNFSVSLFPKGDLNFNVWEVNDTSFKQVVSIDEDYKNSIQKNCTDNQEVVKSKKFSQISSEEHEKVKLPKKLNCDELCSQNEFILKSYSQLLKVLEEYKKTEKTIQLDDSRRNFKREKIQLNGISRRDCLETSWKNFKNNLVEGEFLPKTKIDGRKFKKKESEKTENNENYNNFYFESEQRKKITGNDDEKNIVENEDVREEEKENNIKIYNRFYFHSNETKNVITNDFNEIVEDEYEKKVGKEKEKNVETYNNFYFCSNGKKNFTNIEDEYHAEELNEKEESIQSLYSNEKQNITLINFEENAEEDVELDEEKNDDGDEIDPYDQESIIFRDWYSLYYLQKFAIRQYINYVKQFNYYNGLFNHLKR